MTLLAERDNDRLGVAAQRFEGSGRGHRATGCDSGRDLFVVQENAARTLGFFTRNSTLKTFVHLLAPLWGADRQGFTHDAHFARETQRAPYFWPRGVSDDQTVCSEITVDEEAAEVP